MTFMIGSHSGITMKIILNHVSIQNLFVSILCELQKYMLSHLCRGGSCKDLESLVSGTALGKSKVFSKADSLHCVAVSTLKFGPTINRRFF